MPLAGQGDALPFGQPKPCDHEAVWPCDRKSLNMKEEMARPRGVEPLSAP
jgi:hypothetical protein